MEPRLTPGTAPSDATGAAVPPVAKGTVAATVQALNPEPGQSPTNPAIAAPALAGAQSPAPAGEDTPSTQPSASPEFAQSLLDAQSAKSAGLAQMPILHALDGSALPFAGLLPRPGETLTVSAPAAPLAPAAQPSAQVVQVEGGLRWMLKGGAQEAQLQLHPDSLGQVTIHLKVVGSEVHARMWITEPGSVQAVQEGRPHLEMALKEQGLQLGSFDLQQGQQPSQEAPTAPPTREPSIQDVVTTRQEAPAAPPTNILNAHHVELYA